MHELWSIKKFSLSFYNVQNTPFFTKSDTFESEAVTAVSFYTCARVHFVYKTYEDHTPLTMQFEIMMMSNENELLFNNKSLFPYIMFDKNYEDVRIQRSTNVQK
jgi:hypothetical protein